MKDLTPTQASRRLTAPEFQGLADVPPELEWFANLDNPRTRRAYERDVRDFMGFIGIGAPAEFRTVTRAHLIAWRKDLEHRALARATIRRKLSALSSLLQYLCEKNAAAHNPVDSVKRPTAHVSEGATPALSDQARTLLNAPLKATLKATLRAKGDRAILATLLYHGLRPAELYQLKIKDLQQREGVAHLRVEGKRDKIRFIPAAPVALRLIGEYLIVSEHIEDLHGPLFRPVRSNRTGTLARPLHPESVYQNIMRHYGTLTGITLDVHGFCVHALRATAATNSLSHQADIARVQAWLGHATIATTRIYHKRQQRPADSPTYKDKY
jgi:site-specific recombinase XerD